MLTLLLSLVSAQAATLEVCPSGCTYSSIQLAVAAASPGDTVRVGAGSYRGFVAALAGDIAIEAAPGVRPVITEEALLAPGSLVAVSAVSGITLRGFDLRPPEDVRGVRALLGAGLTLEDVSIVGVSIDANGGSVRVEGGSDVVLRDCVLEDADVGDEDDGAHLYVVGASVVELFDTEVRDGRANDGGGAYVSGATLRVHGGSWSGLRADRSDSGGYGGAIYAGSLSQLTVDGEALFEANEAERGGGHIAVSSSSADLDGVRLSSGLADDGGSLYASNADLTVIGATIEKGEALDDGGHLYATGAAVEIEDSAIVGASAERGGLAWVSGGSLTSVDTDWMDGEAVSDGGGTGIGGLLRLEATQASFTGGVLSGGRAADDGGGLYATTTALSVIEAEVLDNVAVDNGGALFGGVDAFSTASGGTWSGNTAGNTGGGAFLTGRCSLAIDGTTFDENSATLDGGAVGYACSVELDVEDARFTANTAGRDGGALYHIRASADSTGGVRVVRSEFVGNAATGNGGAVWARRGARLWLEDNRFESNTGADGGAVGLRETVALTTTRNLFCLNAASDDGGGLYAENLGGAPRLRSDRFLENSAVDDGGGVRLTGGAVAAELSHLTFAGNAAAEGGALHSHNRSTALISSIVADTPSGFGVFTTGSGALTLTTSAWWNNLAGDLGGVAADVALGPPHVLADPRFQGYARDGACDDLLWVEFDSPTVDAGAVRAGDVDPDDTIPSASSPPDIGAYGGPQADPEAWEDLDGDGWPRMWDCDPAVGTTFPGADERCNGADDDCDGAVDEEAIDEVASYVDFDGDGYGEDASATLSCEPGPGRVLVGGDCEDDVFAVNPGADELCNGVDDDCSGDADSDAIDRATWFLDADGDGFGDDATAALACEAPSEDHVGAGGDCDDDAILVNPAAAEVCNGVDDDCVGGIDVGAVDAPSWWVDGDGDGYGVGAPIAACVAPAGTADRDGDCDDAALAVNPGADEVCNGVDDDCDEGVDEAGAVDEPTWFRDADGDGFAGPAGSVAACASPGAGWYDAASDCDDTRDDVYPDAPEICDEVDNDCDTEIDEDPVGVATWYADADGDGWGDADATIEACERPEGYVRLVGDCDDDDVARNPGLAELCNGFDDDCDERVDIDAADAPLTYEDLDGDGFGAGAGARACVPPEGWAATGDDCDDTRDDVYPEAPEYCDGVDNDCDEDVDEGVVERPWYADVDGDGFGDEATATVDCAPPEDGWVEVGGDCDDTVAAVNPDAAEVWYDGVDQDCDGNDGDQDGDGVNAEAVGGDDCDDLDPDVFPGAEELPDDGIDQDCDGEDATGDDTSTRQWVAGGEIPLPGSGCGCQSAPGAGGGAWLALGAVGLVLLRRRGGIASASALG